MPRTLLRVMRSLPPSFVQQSSREEANLPTAALGYRVSLLQCSCSQGLRNPWTCSAGTHTCVPNPGNSLWRPSYWGLSWDTLLHPDLALFHPWVFFSPSSWPPTHKKAFVGVSLCSEIIPDYIMCHPSGAVHGEQWDTGEQHFPSGLSLHCTVCSMGWGLD